MVYTVWLCYIMLSILKTLCAVFHFYVFQHFILVVALCVGEMREVSVQGTLGHYKTVSMFSSLGHGSCGQHLFFLYVSVYPHYLLITRCMCKYLHCVFTVFLLSQKSSSAWEIMKTIHVDLLTDFLSHLKNDLSVMSNWFMFLKK